MKKFSNYTPLLYILFTTVFLFFLFREWGYDDPFITYRYSKNLASGFGFVYNLHQKTLSTTTPLFTIVLAFVYKIWDNIPQAAILIGSFCIAISGWTYYKLSKIWDVPWVGYVGLLLYPTFPLVLTTLGSETPLYIALILLAFLLYSEKKLILTAIVSSLAVLTRPDGILVPILLFSHYWITHKTFHRKAFLSIIIFTIITGSWFIFSWLYFGDPLPVTLSVKQSQAKMEISQKFAEGFLTIAKPYFRSLYPVAFFLSALGLINAIIKKRSVLMFLSWTFLYFLAYSILGVSRYFWYYAPLVSGFIVLVGLGFDRLNNRAITPKFFLFIVLAALFVVQAIDAWELHRRPDNRLAVYREVGKWIDANTNPNSTIGILEVGIVGYYANRTMIDFAGLIEPSISRIFSLDSTYQDAAIWTIRHFNPSLIVLHEGMFPQLESLITGRCNIKATFSGKDYSYPMNINIYYCDVLIRPFAP